MEHKLIFFSQLLLASLASLAAAGTSFDATLESRGLPRILFNNDSDDLKWPAYPEHHASVWVPAGKPIALPGIRSSEDYLSLRIGPLAKTAATGLAYCGNFGMPIWEMIPPLNDNRRIFAPKGQSTRSPRQRRGYGPLQTLSPERAPHDEALFGMDRAGSGALAGRFLFGDGCPMALPWAASGVPLPGASDFARVRARFLRNARRMVQGFPFVDYPEK